MFLNVLVLSIHFCKYVSLVIINYRYIEEMLKEKNAVNNVDRPCLGAPRQNGLHREHHNTCKTIRRNRHSE